MPQTRMGLGIVIPGFGGAYDPEVEYEFLMFVRDGYDMYLSKKPSKGIPTSDEAHWFRVTDIAAFLRDPDAVSAFLSDINASVQDVVASAVAGAVGGITTFSTAVVDALPETGEFGVIYFVPAEPAENNQYDEYIWVSDRYERIGNTAVDLSGYVPSERMVNGKKLDADIVLSPQDVGAASKEAFVAHTDDAGAHVSMADRERWDATPSGTVQTVTIGENGPKIAPDAQGNIALPVGVPGGLAALEANNKFSPAFIPTLHMSMFGVRFDGVNAQGERLGDAVGMRFSPSVGDAAGRDDWPDVPIFSAVEYNIDTQTDKILSQKGFGSFSYDGAYGDVFVGFPKGYFRRTVSEDGTIEEWISDKPAPGFSVSPPHFRGGVESPTVYAAKYKAYWTGSALRSISGVYPTGSMTRAVARVRTAALGGGNGNYGLYDAAFHSWLEMLCDVKYAHFNAQLAVGHGLHSLPYDANAACTEATAGQNRVVLSNAQAARFGAGLWVQVGTGVGNTSVTVLPRKILEINALDDGVNTEMIVDGAAFSTAAGNIVWCCGNHTGDCDSIGGACGRTEYFVGTNCQVKAFNLESPWAERWTWEDGHNISDRQSYICTDPAQYADNVFADPYARLSFANAPANGFIKAFGYDPAYPWMAVCDKTGGDNSKPVGDYYYQADGARVSMLGGYLYYGTYCGPRYRSLSYASATASWIAAARVLKNR